MNKVVFLNRFFYPDHSATAQILSDLVQNLDVSGCEIHVVTSQMLYDKPEVVLPANEKWGKIFIHRCYTTRFGRKNLLGRLIDYVSFYVSSFICLLFLVGRNDIVVAKTDPPMISVLANIVTILKRAVLINWLQDLFPEVGKELKVAGFDGIKYSIAKSIRDWSLRNAKYNVAIGQIMANKIDAIVGSQTKAEVIDNWVVGQKMKPVRKEDNALRQEWGLSGKFVVGYSGNLGRAHDIETLYSAMLALKDSQEIVFLFVGGGAGYDEIQARVKENGLANVLFKPYQPSESLAYSLSLPDVHIISLIPDLEGLIVPSKFYGVISVARPIIFIGNEQGELGSILKQNDCGIAVPLGDQLSLVEAIIRLKESNKECDVMSQNALRLYNDKYLPEKSIEKWNSILSHQVNCIR